MLGRTDSRARLVFLLCFLAVFASALGVRLAYWQIGQADDLRARAADQLAAETAEQIRRGEIVDSDGTVLATTAYSDRLVAYPDLLGPGKRPVVARAIADILGLDAQATADLVETFKSAPPYTIVARRLTDDQSESVRNGIRDGTLAGLELEPQPVRFYPNGGGSPDTTLASQLLGFVTEDGQGRYGIEQYGQELLVGADNAVASVDGGRLPLPAAGGQLRLTIDASLQLRLEKELYAAWVADRAPRVSGLVMDPYSGAILAWASVPGYDANEFARVADAAPELFADPIASQVYEPGSVMKIVTAAAALEIGAVDLDTPVADGKTLKIGPDVVRNGDRRSIGVVPFEDIIARSRNVGTGRVALDLGETTAEAAEVMYGMWRRLGIGRPTGIELGNESAGIVSDPGDRPWQAIDVVNRAFGQGVAVTPLQLATAFSAMVNGGRLPVPHLIAAAGDQEVAAPGSRQVMETELSERLRQLMVHVVETGPNYAAETLIPGYVVGGKTGTAQIWDPRARSWMENTYNHTFVGFVGAERPEAVILVRIHDTQPRVKRKWGWSLEMTSNELFRRVALDTITALEIAPLGGDPPFDPPAVPPAASPGLDESAPESLPDGEPLAPPPSAVPARAAQRGD